MSEPTPRYLYPQEGKPFLPGHLLVASPYLQQQTLSQSVVLVLDHSSGGAQGIVLNSQANEAMKSWCRQMAQQPDKQAVFQQLQAVASSAAEFTDASEGLPLTVCMARPTESLEEMVDQLGHDVRIYIGRVTWQSGQLESETEAGAWMILPALPEIVFGDHENLWRTCVRRIGQDVIASLPGVQGFPQSVLLN